MKQMSASVSRRQYLVTLMSNFLTHSVHLRRHDAEPFSEPMKTWTYNSNFCTKHAKGNVDYIIYSYIEKI